jgi:putative phosphoribosyl transferase
MGSTTHIHGFNRQLFIPTQSAMLEGNFITPEAARGIVVFAQGSGSQRLGHSNRHIAQHLQRAGFATLMIDLLTRDETATNQRNHHFPGDVNLLTQRLVAITEWLAQHPAMRHLPLGYFAAGTDTGVALTAAAICSQPVGAIVCQSGRSDLAHTPVCQIQTPILLIAGEHDGPIIAMNQDAQGFLCAQTQLEIVPNATHLFEEPGALEAVARLTIDWFEQYLPQPMAVSGLATSGSGARRV